MRPRGAAPEPRATPGARIPPHAELRCRPRSPSVEVRSGDNRLSTTRRRSAAGAAVGGNRGVGVGEKPKARPWGRCRRGNAASAAGRRPADPLLSPSRCCPRPAVPVPLLSPSRCAFCGRSTFPSSRGDEAPWGTSPPTPGVVGGGGAVAAFGRTSVPGNLAPLSTPSVFPPPRCCPLSAPQAVRGDTGGPAVTAPRASGLKIWGE